MQKNSIVYQKTQACSSEFDQIQIQKSFDPVEKSSQDKLPNSNNLQKNSSMQKFCAQFYQNYYDKINQIFTIQQITTKYKVKNRRVYDLLGILQGFSFVQKLKKKSTYLWVDMNQAKCTFNFQQNKSIALKDIAGLLKLLLRNNANGLTIKELNHKITVKIEEITKKQQSKVTINRRIYECLKVMRIFGMVNKSENIFKLIRSSKRTIVKTNHIIMN